MVAAGPSPSSGAGGDVRRPRRDRGKADRGSGARHHLSEDFGSPTAPREGPGPSETLEGQRPEAQGQPGPSPPLSASRLPW